MQRLVIHVAWLSVYLDRGFGYRSHYQHSIALRVRLGIAVRPLGPSNIPVMPVHVPNILGLHPIDPLAAVEGVLEIVCRTS